MRLFDIIPIRVVDVLEIAIVAYILYKLYQLMRGTIAVQIFFGVMALYLVQVIVNAADMTMLSALFSSISEVFVLAVIILFQPEIRRLRSLNSSTTPPFTCLRAQSAKWLPLQGAGAS